MNTMRNSVEVSVKNRLFGNSLIVFILYVLCPLIKNIME
jgi:hypothetical protein